ncbi:amidohydrolase family protein [Xylophilus rhododendri]|uniref:Amidohydrolase family protein n=1 Tax=Xylophilus rhododendri TaxID=2697032 RepID=A0A857IZ40_9BURK|nr:amidohydrolase family protein [Xylophilus rhododendri]QHI96854.1 amidohydrolase family protein [Xylophilus rhododendri]
MSTAQRPYLPFDPVVASPRQRLPTGSCDCHFHVFEDPRQFPLGEPRTYTPTLATLDHYRAMARAVGLERAVLVHPSVYGRDHRTFERALAASQDWMRGVAVVFADTAQEDIARWHALGSRGTRCNSLFAGGAEVGALAAVADRVRPFGWHLQMLVDVSATPALLGHVAGFGLPLVVDHFGHLPIERGVQDAGFRNLLALLREGNTWVKLSGPYRLTATRQGFADLQPLVDRLLDANPDRLVWGSDWPHPAITPPPMVNDGALADALFDWLDADARQKVLVDNPTQLYWKD